MSSRFLYSLSVVAALGVPLAASPAARGQTRAAIATRVAGLEGEVSAASRQLHALQVAQLFNRPPADVPDQDTPDGYQPQNAAGLDLRVDRLEGQLRSLTGQIEQTQFAIRRLEEDLHKFEQDVDFRLQDQSGRPPPRPLPQKRADLGDQPPAYPPPSALPLPGSLPAPATAPPARRGDAFDPDAEPGAPGAPRPLGTPPRTTPPPAAAPTGPIVAETPGDDDDPTAPLDLSRISGNPPPPRTGVAPAQIPPGTMASTGVPGPAALSPAVVPGMAGPRDDFDAALAVLKQGQYETAQTDFQAFIQKYPKDRLVPDAVYYLGETYAQRGRHREAAEQYLKVATDYAKSARAPDGLVRLGVSLNALGAKEQACATFGEVARKYPNASVAVKSSVDREMKRAKC